MQNDQEGVNREENWFLWVVGLDWTLTFLGESAAECENAAIFTDVDTSTDIK